MYANNLIISFNNFDSKCTFRIQDSIHNNICENQVIGEVYSFRNIYRNISSKKTGIIFFYH